MNRIVRIAQISFRALFPLYFFLPVFAGLGMNNQEKMEELRERSERILASLNSLDARLQGMRTGEATQVANPPADPSPQEQVIWEDQEDIPLPDETLDPAGYSESSTSGSSPDSEVIDWNSVSTTKEAEDSETADLDEMDEKAEQEFNFVIEDFEESEEQDPYINNSFDSSDSEYTLSGNDYYVIFNYGILLGSEIDFSSNALGGISGEIETDTGHGISLEFGYSFGMLELGILAGFNNQDVTGFAGSVSGVQSSGAGNGEISNYYLALTPNVVVELSDSIDFRGGISLGFSSKHNSFESGDINNMASELDLLGINSSSYKTNFDSDDRLPKQIFHEEKICFLWDFHTTLQWALWENGGLLFGYRFAYISGTGDFDSQISNSFEFGGRMGF